MVLLVGDWKYQFEQGQEQYAHIPMRNQYMPEIGYWCDHVPTDDLYADTTPGGALEVRVGRLPVHGLADVEAAFHNLVVLFWNQYYLAFAPDPLPEYRTDWLPPAIENQPLLVASYQAWAAAADSIDANNAARWSELPPELQTELAASGRGPESSASYYLSFIDAFVEDYDREGRLGIYPEEHATELLGSLNVGTWSTSYVGDLHPWDYPARAERADAHCNWGHQILIMMGTKANRSKAVNMQNVDQGWDVDRLFPNGQPSFLLGMCCDLGDIDMVENYGRPYVERAMFSPNRGYVGAVVPTRTIREWPAYWFGLDVCQRIAQATESEGDGITIGKAWIETKNELLATRPNHTVEWRELILLGDPSARIVPGHGVVTDVASSMLPLRLNLEARPNPFTTSTAVQYMLPLQSNADVRVFDAAGRRVRTLVPTTPLEAGTYSVEWDGLGDHGRTLNSGVYFVRLRTPHERRSFPVIFVR